MCSIIVRFENEYWISNHQVVCTITLNESYVCSVFLSLQIGNCLRICLPLQLPIGDNILMSC